VKESSKITIEKIQPQNKPTKKNLIQIPMIDKLGGDNLKVLVEDDVQRKRKDSFFGFSSQLKNDYEEQQPEINVNGQSERNNNNSSNSNNMNNNNNGSTSMIGFVQ
jgi:hypothetical protein